MLDKYNVLLLSVNESLPEGASGKLMYNIISSINDFYLENLRHEVKEKTLVIAKKDIGIRGQAQDQPLLQFFQTLDNNSFFV